MEATSRSRPVASAAASLRNLLAAKRLAVAIGAHDAIGAKLAERAGFDVVWSSGLEVSASRGVPDANILSMAECLDAAATIARSSRLPVLADCDSGFGSVANVVHMVREYEARGIAGVCIEDKVFPKLNSFAAGRQRLEPVEQFAAKILAAKDAQRDEAFVVVARIESLIAGTGMDDTIARAAAYCDAGADAILVHSKAPTAHEIITFAERFRRDVPLIAVPTKYPSVTARELEEAGVAMVIYANHGLRSAIRAMAAAFDAIRRDGSTLAMEPHIASIDEVLSLTGTDVLGGVEGRYERLVKEDARARREGAQA